MQLSNTPDKLVLPFAVSGAKNTIPAASQVGIVAGKASLTDGFPPLTRTPLSAGGVPPSGLDMNGILYEMSAAIRWANAGGGYPFDGIFADDLNVSGYPKGARVMRSDGLGYWLNVTENNTTDPEDVISAVGWVPDFTNGVASIAMTNANVTLTPVQYGKPIIIISGTLTADLSLIFPTIAGSWTVFDKTNGNYSIAAKTMAGTGSILPKKSPCTVICDTVNVISLGTAILLNVKNFGARGDGLTDDTAAISAAIAFCVAKNFTLFFPAGTYLCGTISAAAGMKLVGADRDSTTIKLKSGTNAGLITSPSLAINDVLISNMTFDGNSAGNTDGDVLAIKGYSPILTNLRIVNSAGTAVTTDFDSSNVSGISRLKGFQGYFSNILINASQKHGWSHSGPNDSTFESIIIIDAGLKTTNTFIGFWAKGASGNGKFSNCHHWNEYFTTNVPSVGFQIDSSGNVFTNCHFEGSNLPLNINSSGNNFGQCDYYATRSTYCVNFSPLAIGNVLSGVTGVGAYSGNPAYFCASLQGSGNKIVLVNVGSGCTNGVIDFQGDAGNNLVEITGYQTTGSVYANTPHVSDDVTISVSGAAGIKFRQELPIPWTSTFVPVVTASTGTFTTVAATCRYIKKGETVHFVEQITMTTVGTAANTLLSTVPVAAVAGATFIVSGRKSGTGEMLQGTIVGNVLSINTYNNSSPIGAGITVYISGTYESA